MNKITKETIERIKAGYHDDLIDAIEFLIDSYDTNKFDSGYDSCMDDVIMYSHRLADHIVKNTTIGDRDAVKSDFTTCAVNDLAKVIENYYIKLLNKKYE